MARYKKDGWLPKTQSCVRTNWSQSNLKCGACKREWNSSYTRSGGKVQLHLSGLKLLHVHTAVQLYIFYFQNPSLITASVPWVICPGSLACVGTPTHAKLLLTWPHYMCEKYKSHHSGGEKKHLGHLNVFVRHPEDLLMAFKSLFYYTPIRYTVSFPQVIRDILLLGHRQAFAWIDEWIGKCWF